MQSRNVSERKGESHSVRANIGSDWWTRHRSVQGSVRNVTLIREFELTNAATVVYHGIRKRTILQQQLIHQYDLPFALFTVLFLNAREVIRLLGAVSGQDVRLPNSNSLQNTLCQNSECHYEGSIRPYSSSLSIYLGPSPVPAAGVGAS